MNYDTDYYLNQANFLAIEAKGWNPQTAESRSQLALAYAMMAVAREMQAQRLLPAR